VLSPCWARVRGARLVPGPGGDTVRAAFAGLRASFW